MEDLLRNWWLWSVAAGCLLLALAGALRLRRLLAAPASASGRQRNGGVVILPEGTRQPLPDRCLMEPGETPGVPGFASNLPEALADLNEQTGLVAWRTQSRELAKRRRETALLDSEIQTAKKRIEYIRTIAEQSSVVDEERLRIAQLRQEMRRLEQEEARGDLEDQVGRKRLEKELAELERDIRTLSQDPEVLRPVSEAEKRQEILRREAERQAFEVALQTQKAKQGLAARQALLEAMNQEIEKIKQNPNLTAEQKSQLAEDTQDYYQDLIARAG